MRRRSLGRSETLPPNVIPWHVAVWADSLAVADGAAVTSWPDISGNARNLDQLGGTGPIMRTSGINGRRAVEGTGNAQGTISCSAFSALSKPHTLVAIGTAPGSGGTLVSGRWDSVVGATNQRPILYSNATSTWQMYNGSVATYGTYRTGPFVVAGVFNEAASKGVDGTSATSSLSTGTGGGAVVLRLFGYYHPTGTSYSTGRIAFAGIYAGDVTAHPNWSAFLTWAASYYGFSL